MAVVSAVWRHFNDNPTNSILIRAGQIRSLGLR